MRLFKRSLSNAGRLPELARSRSPTGTSTPSLASGIATWWPPMKLSQARRKRGPSTRTCWARGSPTLIPTATASSGSPTTQNKEHGSWVGTSTSIPSLPRGASSLISRRGRNSSSKIAAALVQGAETLKRRADGDYGPDEMAKRFPVWRRDRADPASGCVKLTFLLDGWAKESRPARSTLDLWWSYMARFVEYIGRDDALSVQRSDIVSWKQHLVELGNTTKTINDSKLAALRAAFRSGVDNDLLPANPAAGVFVRHRKRAGETMLGFERGEAATILKAAAEASDPVRRWVPLLCAQSGARVSEVYQLRGEDIQSEDGIPYMHFRPEAGALKNAASERKVPLHPHVIAAGFVEFAKRSGRGPLFYETQSGGGAARGPRRRSSRSTLRGGSTRSGSRWAAVIERTPTTLGVTCSALLPGTPGLRRAWSMRSKATQPLQSARATARPCSAQRLAPLGVFRFRVCLKNAGCDVPNPT